MTESLLIPQVPYIPRRYLQHTYGYGHRIFTDSTLLPWWPTPTPTAVHLHSANTKITEMGCSLKLSA